MITWTKPSGLTITTPDIDRMISYAKEHGWTRKEEKPVAYEKPESKKHKKSKKNKSK